MSDKLVGAFKESDKKRFLIPKYDFYFSVLSFNDAQIYVETVVNDEFVNLQEKKYLKYTSLKYNKFYKPDQFSS